MLNIISVLATSVIAIAPGQLEEASGPIDIQAGERVGLVIPPR